MIINRKVVDASRSRTSIYHLVIGHAITVSFDELEVGQPVAKFFVPMRAARACPVPGAFTTKAGEFGSTDL